MGCMNLKQTTHTQYRRSQKKKYEVQNNHKLNYSFKFMNSM